MGGSIRFLTFPIIIAFLTIPQIRFMNLAYINDYIFTMTFRTFSLSILKKWNFVRTQINIIYHSITSIGKTNNSNITTGLRYYLMVRYNSSFKIIRSVLLSSNMETDGKVGES